MMRLRQILRQPLLPSSYMSLRLWNFLGSALLNLFVFSLLVMYLFPIAYMGVTALQETQPSFSLPAPLWPSRLVQYDYQGQKYPLYRVATSDGLVHQWALIHKYRTRAEFIDPAHPEAGLIPWEGNWRGLEVVYEFHPSLESFAEVWQVVDFANLGKNTLIIAGLGEIGVLLSSIAVAYGFSRFPIPGGKALFFLMIATLLIPEKITLIPTYFIFLKYLGWNATWMPLIAPHFFGNAIFIFLLRQNFKSIPRDLDEAAMLDGAGPLRILVSIILPQSVPVVSTVALLHFFYVWNESRLASLYLGTRPDLQPISAGIVNYQSLIPQYNVLQASALIVMAIPVLVLLLSQRFFMKDLIVTGIEK